MRVEVTEYGVIWLYGETPLENNLLEALDKEGVKVTGRSSTGIAINSPAKAGLRQLFINREQQSMLSYTLGIMDVLVLLESFTKMVSGGTVAMGFKDTEQILRNLGNIKNQLFIAPEPIYATPRAYAFKYPKARKPKKTEQFKCKKCGTIIKETDYPFRERHLYKALEEEQICEKCKRTEGEQEEK